jgi:drug/metabolite transporter (DMT)-like permease
MLQWRVILLAALAVLLLLGGLSALILPAPQEGMELYRLDEQHGVRALDILGAVLLVLGCAVAWSAGALWQRRMYAS